jgi:predicted  nucleic acid-binding Zn-ribbon protein
MDNNELNLDELENVTAGFTSNVDAMEAQKEELESQLDKTFDPNERQTLMAQIDNLEEQIQALKGMSR